MYCLEYNNTGSSTLEACTVVLTLYLLEDCFLKGEDIYYLV